MSWEHFVTVAPFNKSKKYCFIQLLTAVFPQQLRLLGLQKT